MIAADDPRPAIVFDLGAVLVDWNPRYLYRKLFVDEAEMEYFLKEVCSPEWNVQQDTGRPFAEGIQLLTDCYPKYNLMIKAYFERWDEMVPGVIQGAVDILYQLHHHEYFLCALSNWSAETFPIAQQRFKFFNCFAEIVLSGEELVCKPDKQIYQILLSRIDREPQSCIFIDDSLPNITAAQALGFQGIHFQSPELLRQQLAACHSSLAELFD